MFHIYMCANWNFVICFICMRKKTCSNTYADWQWLFYNAIDIIQYTAIILLLSLAMMVRSEPPATYGPPSSSYGTPGAGHGSGGGHGGYEEVRSWF